MFESLDKISMFGDKISYNISFFIIDLVFAIHFFYSWYISYKTTGWKIDYWNISIIQLILFPVILQYPFISSSWNYFSVGESYNEISKFAEKAFFITILGYIFMNIGSLLCKINFNKNMKFNILDKIIFSNINNKFIINSLTFISCVCCFFVIFVQVKNGCLFNPRLFFLQNSIYRPLFNFSGVLIGIVGTYLSLRVIEFKLKKEKILLFIIFVLSLFMGSRALTIGIVLNYFLFGYYYNYKNIEIKKVFVLAVILVFSAFIFTVIRSGITELESYGNMFFLPILMLVYGNTFSDLRDFAWILSSFNDKFLWGNTYLAALISFFPRIFSSFREEWSIGVYTAELLGFSIEAHPGLRSGIFGELYLNFSYIGVAIGGLITGYYLRYIDMVIRYYVIKGKSIIKGYAKTIFLSSIVFGLFNTSGFWSIYAFLVINLALLISSVIWKRFTHNV